MSDPKQTPATQLPAVQKKEASSFLESPSVIDAVAKVIPKHITPERLVRVATTAVMSSPELLQAAATPIGKASLLNALMRCSQAGLEPDGRMAHLIPYWNSKHGCYIVQVIFDYKGLVVLAKRNGIDAKAMLVKEHDQFEYIEDDGTGKTVVNHRFDPFKDRGKIIGAYSRAVESGKVPDYEFMPVDEIESIRLRSKAKDSGPWKTDYGEMAKKTPLRRHSKRWELQPEIREAINADDDTPPELDKGPKVVAPLFAEPGKNPELENGHEPATAPAELEAPKPEKPQEPPKPEKKSEAPKPEPPKPSPGGFNPVKAFRNLCAKDGLTEKQVCEFLLDIGSIDQPVDSAEELQLNNPSELAMVVEQWSDIVNRIKGAQS